MTEKKADVIGLILAGGVTFFWGAVVGWLLHMAIF